MATETITVRNTLNGLLAEVTPAVLANPHLAKHLVAVEEENPKPLNISSPATAEEFKARRSRRPKDAAPAPKDSTPTEEG